MEPEHALGTTSVMGLIPFCGEQNNLFALWYDVEASSSIVTAGG
jgi:hypothetical protein